ncbi:MAG: sugar phosphate isomerase/epimerase [Bryobacterales bacterium]|nr:sugar phosphate isomerase/epimerase [Bryobacterales bacterium]
MERRSFLAGLAALPAVAPAAGRLPIKKALYISMLPRDLSYADRFKMARDTGFEEMEVGTTPDQKEAEEIRKAAQAAGVRIHSVMNQAHWKFPLSSADPSVVAESIKGMEASLRNARFWGADTVLLVPAVVNPETSYRDALTRSRENIRKLLPLAQELKVVIALENVSNKFLLSPVEFADYVDGFRSPWVRAYFDVGNIIPYGFPQDWIRTLGSRIAKLHLKDCSVRKNQISYVALREGDVNWRAVYEALAETGFSGTATCELAAGDEAYLRDVSQRVDMILAGTA